MMEPRSEACPQEVLDWIAWYPEGDLPERVRGAIEAHAAECAHCREEIAMLGERAEPSNAELPDIDAVFSRVMARIASDAASAGLTTTPAWPTDLPAKRAEPDELGESDRSAEPDELGESGRSAEPDELGEPTRWRGHAGSGRRAPGPRLTRAPRRAALAAGVILAMLAGLAGGLAGTWLQSGAEDVWRTAVVPPAESPGRGVRLAVVFGDDMTVGQIRANLRAVDAVIVDGPSADGVFQVELATRDVEAGARQLRALGAVLAEPLGP